MQENLLFEYAVIRVVPHVEREEFINAGVILYCSPKKFLKTIITLDENRLKPLCRKLDIDEIRAHISSFEQIASGGGNSGPIGKLTPAERFRWLTATRSTVIQTSKVHPGLTHDPQAMLERLHKQLVLLEEC
jgi:hypothetical protein